MVHIFEHFKQTQLFTLISKVAKHISDSMGENGIIIRSEINK